MKITDRILSVCSLERVEYGSMPKTELHCKDRPFDGFVYILSGSAVYGFDRKITVGKGDILFLAHHSDYSICVTSDNYTFIVVDFLFENKENDVAENEVFSFPSVNGLENRFAKFEKKWSLGTFADQIECFADLYRIYAEIVRCRTMSYIPSSYHSLLQKTVDYIGEHYDDPDLSVGRLSAMLNISEVHYRRLFEKVYRLSPIKYITAYRIQKAKQYLIDPSLSVETVARRCGFSGTYYFSRVFKAASGMTPTEFRKRNDQIN